VLAGPGDNRTAAARSRLRASQTERERAVDALKAAYVQDRLTMDEFDDRLGHALAAGTYAELAALTEDIPVAPAAAGPPGRAARRQAGHAARWGASGLVSPALAGVGLASASLNGGSGFWVVAVVAAIVYFVVWLSAGADMLWQWHCMSQPGTGMCVRCAHTAASHRTPVTCVARPGAPGLRSRCPCAGYVPPGVSPQAADLRPFPAHCR
jgi:Domain of unknown function (DUF1707)